MRFENIDSEEINHVFVNDIPDQLLLLEKDTNQPHTMLFFYTGHGVMCNKGIYTSCVGNYTVSFFFIILVYNQKCSTNTLPSPFYQI